MEALTKIEMAICRTGDRDRTVTCLNTPQWITLGPPAFKHSELHMAMKHYLHGKPYDLSRFGGTFEHPHFDYKASTELKFVCGVLLVRSGQSYTISWKIFKDLALKFSSREDFRGGKWTANITIAYWRSIEQLLQYHRDVSYCSSQVGVLQF